MEGFLEKKGEFASLAGEDPQEGREGGPTWLVQKKVCDDETKEKCECVRVRVFCLCA